MLIRIYGLLKCIAVYKAYNVFKEIRVKVAIFFKSYQGTLSIAWRKI